MKLPTRGLVRGWCTRYLFAAAAIVDISVGCGPVETNAGPGAGASSAGSVGYAADSASGGDAKDPSGIGDASGSALVKNLILVSIDTLRADRLESFGYEKPTSPYLEAFGARSVVFEAAQSQSSQTAPSHASLFTSTYPGTHGIYNVHGDHREFPTLPAGLTTLAEVLERSDRETAAFVCGGNLTKHMKMNRGFGVWDERNEDIRERVDALLAWLDRPRTKPFFVLLHTYQVHSPYLPPAELVPKFTDPAYNGPLRARMERYLKLPQEQAWQGGVGPDYWEGMLDYTKADVQFLSDLYDAEIAHVDAELRRVFEAVLSGPFSENTAIVIVADHGEEFRDHGKFQHDQTYEELIHVPLIVHLPVGLQRNGWTGRVGTGVQLIDVAPTVAELLGVDWGGYGWKGRSLVRMLDPSSRAVAGAAAVPRFSELRVDPGPKFFGSVTANGWKYTHIHQLDIDVTWQLLFDLRTDPTESRNLIHETDPEVVRALESLKALLADFRVSNALDAQVAGSTGSAEMNDESRRDLDALGYTGGSTTPAKRSLPNGPK